MAIERGASALVVESLPQESVQASGIPWIQVSDANAAMATMASNLFERPTEQMNVVGITGTNGKTSTAFLIEHALNSNESSCGLMGTVVQRWPTLHNRSHQAAGGFIRIERMFNQESS